MTGEPVVVGPQGLPERSIIKPVAAWAMKWLRQPDGPNAGQRWEFTQQQLRILAWWYAYDENGRWLYRRGTVRMCKGWGKDPFGAVIAANELLGPCRVVDGEAVPHPAPWIQIAAVSRDQTRTTMRLFPGLFSQEAIEQYGLDINKEIIYAKGGRAVIEAVTSSPSSLEGGRATLVMRNEVQEWRSTNDGHDMAEVIDGNLAKSRDGAGRALSLCNAHVPGEDTVGEREWDAYQAVVAGRTRVSDIFYCAIEAPADTKLDDAASVKHGLEVARGDSVWLDVDRLAAEIWDPRTTPSEARRKYLNQIVAAEDAWVAPHEWNACKLEDAKLEDGSLITLGFDGSKSGDFSALMACRVDDGCVFTLDVWDPERTGGEIDRDLVDGAVQHAFGNFDVVGFYSDVHPFESYVDKWRNEHGAMHRRKGLCVAATPRHPIAWDMRTRQAQITYASERFHDGVVEHQLLHDGDPRLTEHVLNARNRLNRWGTTFGKEHRESNRKVDALAAAVLARTAYLDYLALPKAKQRLGKGKTGFF